MKKIWASDWMMSTESTWPYSRTQLWIWLGKIHTSQYLKALIHLARGWFRRHTGPDLHVKDGRQPAQLVSSMWRCLNQVGVQQSFTLQSISGVSSNILKMFSQWSDALFEVPVICKVPCRESFWSNIKWKGKVFWNKSDSLCFQINSTCLEPD